MRPTVPPTTPPTMAPVCEDEPEDEFEAALVSEIEVVTTAVEVCPFAVTLIGRKAGQISAIYRA